MARSPAPPPRLLAIALILLFLAAAAAAASGLSLSSAFGGSGSELSLGRVAAAGSSGCRGRVGECLGEAEFELGVSEATRRILARSDYISYGAIDRNRTPCSRRGASYYNCRPGAHRNPYHRGCSAIARCRT